MNVSSGVWETTSELVSVPGRLFIIRPHGVKSAKECIFINAVLSVRRTTREFCAELVVTRAWAEGEQELAEEDDDNLDERPFLLDEALHFAARPATVDDVDGDEPGDAYSFSWWDLSGPSLSSSTYSGAPESPAEEAFLFVTTTDVAQSDIDHVLDLVRRACYERKYQQSADQATASELAEFANADADAPPAQLGRNKEEPPLFRPETPSDDGVAPADSDDEVTNTLARDVGRVSLASTAAATAATSARSSAAGPSRAPATPQQPVASTSRAPPLPVASPQQKASPPEGVPLPPDQRKLLLTETSDLYLYDRSTGMFMVQERQVQANLWLVDGEKFPCWLSIAGENGQIWVSTPVDNQMPLTFSENELSLVFNYHHAQLNKNFTWLIRVSTKESFARLNAGFSRGLFEASYGRNAWAKLNDVERRYAQDAYIQDAEMAASDDDTEPEDELEAEEVHSAVEESDQDVEADAGEDDEELVSQVRSDAPKTKNSALAVGHKNDLSFVVRGDMIGVFQSQSGGGKRLKFMTSIQGISTPDGKRLFEPAKVMLHDQDTSMLLRDPANPYSLYRLDLHTGKVAEELKVHDNITVDNFLPDSKYAQTTGTQTFVGHSHNSVFRVDPRLAGNKMVDSQFKQYATKSDFSAAATTEAGGLAVASNKGEIRLYDQIGKNAKTALPSLGDGITGIDVSADGVWVVATCPTYLLLIDTRINDGRYSGSLGFNRSFPTTAKPTPRRLTLRPEHTAYLKQPLRFTTARFNAGPDATEKQIITSTGEFVIAWNFRKVKNGQLDAYTIKRYDQAIIQDSFRFNQDRDIVVVQAADVFQESRGVLEVRSVTVLVLTHPETDEDVARRRAQAVRHCEGVALMCDLHM